MAEVLLVRPGCTDFDEQNRIQGSLDLPLNDRGEQQVQQIVDQLHDVALEVVFTAPSDPARTTAAAIGDDHGVNVKELEDFRNLDQGLWEGLPIDEIRRKYPKVYRQWHDSPESICPPEGEPISDALRRIHRALQKPLKRRQIFAVVASEPIATLISCVLCGDRPHLPESMGRHETPPAIELLHTNGSGESAHAEHRTSLAARIDVAAQGGAHE